MPQIPHIEHHFTGSEFVRDIVIGMSDGLTVPFALAAGLSGIANSTTIVITGGLAEIAAGSIAMGLGGYLAAKSDAEHYTTERATEQREVEAIPEVEVAEVEHVFSVVFTLIALVIFGYVKGRFTGTRPFRSAFQTAMIGGLAAAVAFGLARLISR